MSHYLIFLAIIPLVTFQLCKIYAPSRLWLFTGLTVGMVIAPVSQGLVDYSMIPIIGGVIGLVGAVFNMIHGSVGYFFLGAIGTFEPDTVLNASQLTLMNLVNAAIWTTYYSVVGCTLDAKYSKKVERKYAAVSALKAHA